MNRSESYPIFHWQSLKKTFKHRELYQAIAFLFGLQLFPIGVTLGSMYPGYSIIITVATSLIGCMILALALRVIIRRQRIYNYVNRVRILPVLGLFIGCIIMLTIMNYIYTLMGINYTSQPNQVSLDAMFNSFPFVMIFMITILAPVIEELVFRELLPNAFGASYVSFIASSFIFVVIHSPSGIMGWTSYAIMATGFLYARLSQRSIYASIALHIVWNTVSVVL